MTLIAAVRQHRHHPLMIGVGNEHVDIQMTFPLVGLLGQNVSRMRMAAFDLAGRRQPKALRSTLVCFQFRHNSLPFIFDFQLPIADLLVALPREPINNWQSNIGIDHH